MKKIIPLLLTLLMTAPAHAYKPDYELRGKFLVEATLGSETQLELWDINLLKGLKPGTSQLAFIDFKLVKVSLSNYGKNKCHRLSDIDVHTYDPEYKYSRLLESNGSFHYE